MLQLWRARPSCQRVSAAPSAQKVPFLSEPFPHGGQLSAQSAAAAAAAAVSQLTGNSYLTEGRGRGAKPCRWNLWVTNGGILWGFSLEHFLQKELPQVLFIELQKSYRPLMWCAVEQSADRHAHFENFYFLSVLFFALDKCLSCGTKQSDVWFSHVVATDQVLIWTDLTWCVPPLMESFLN